MSRAGRLLAGLVVLAVAIGAGAEEGGAGHYAPGAFASFADVLPSQPGVVAFNYFTDYDGTGSLDHQFLVSGRLALKLGGGYSADTVGAFWVTPLKVLGANLAAGLSLPYVKTDIQVKVTHPGGNTVDRSDSGGGLGDIEFWPIALCWSAMSGNLHVDFLGGVYAPSGKVDKTHLANPGLGYWTFEPGVVIGYLGQKNGFEFTSYIGYDINTENHTTDYRSGQVFHIDATIAQHFQAGRGLIGIGTNGFYVKQTTPDGGNAALLGSFEEMTLGVGPAISYATQFKRVGLVAEVKWLPQLSAEHAVRGSYLWFKIGVQF
jgi:hypothetical protein